MSGTQDRPSPSPPQQTQTAEVIGGEAEEGDRLKSLSKVIWDIGICVMVEKNRLTPMTASYLVIYDGNCNLCSTLVQALEQLEHGSLFRYVPMQETEALAQWQITAEDCEMGMILLNIDNPQQRWQGSDAAEEIARLLPAGAAVIQVYRAIPGLKGLGDHTYTQVRDNRYAWFGRRSQTYQSQYPYTACPACDGDKKQD